MAAITTTIALDPIAPALPAASNGTLDTDDSTLTTPVVPVCEPTDSGHVSAVASQARTCVTMLEQQPQPESAPSSPATDPLPAAPTPDTRSVRQKTTRPAGDDDERPRQKRRVEDPVILPAIVAVNPMSEQQMRDRLKALERLAIEHAGSRDLQGQWITCACRKSAQGRQFYWRGKVTKQSRYVEVTWSHVFRSGGWTDIKNADGQAVYIHDSLPSHDAGLRFYAIDVCPAPPAGRDQID